MLIILSKNNIPIRITEERWNHITSRHPEMCEQKEKVLETIKEPDLIQKGDFKELLAIRFYKRTPLTQKFLVVAYREVSNEDGFVITTYFTRRVSERRETLWKQ